MKKITSFGILVVGSFLIVGMWVGYALLKFDHTMEKWGVFGDKFGALNTLFTGLASVAVVAALWHEREGAAEREREHKELLAAMTAQTEASLRSVQMTAYIQTIKRCDDLISRNRDATSAEEVAINLEADKVRAELYEKLVHLCGKVGT